MGSATGKPPEPLRCGAAVLALAAGALLALPSPWSGVPQQQGSGRGTARWALADRDACEVVLLDEDLLGVESLVLPWPTRVRGRPQGGLWVVSATQGHPGAGHQLWLLERGGGERSLYELPPVADLEVDPRGRAWLLVRLPGAGVEVWRATGAASLARHHAPDDARALVIDGDRVALVAADTGLLVLREAGDGWRPAWSARGGALLDAAPAGGGGWWLLARADVPGSERVLRLDTGDSVVESVPSPGAERLAAGRGAQAACWVVGEEGGWVRRLDLNAARRTLHAERTALGADAAAVDRNGGLVLATGGALLRLDLAARPAPGQGGFEHLADLDLLGPP